MDLASLIKSKKKHLKATTTIVTTETGDKFEISCGKSTLLSDKASPFVVDEKSDLQMALIMPGIYLSSQDPIFNLELLQTHKIKHIISLGIKPPAKFQDIHYHYFEILDLPDFDLIKCLDTCHKILDKHQSENILVHCNAGVSRSPALVISYLMRQENLTYNEAYTRVKTIRSCIRPNDGFIKQLKCHKFHSK